jgi:capsular polysaccharide biosynthesis protein
MLSLRPKVYEASAEIYLDASRGATSFDAGMATGELLSHDFIVMGTSRPVLAQACATPGVNCSPAELASPDGVLARRVSVNVYRGTSMLTVAGRAAIPDDAAALANAVAQAIIDHDKSEIVRLMKPGLDDLQKQLTQLQTAMDAEQAALQHSPTGSSTAAAHAAQLTRLQGQYSATFAREQDAIQLQDHMASVATIAQPATTPVRPASPDPLRYLAAALVAGICMAVLIVLLVERFDDRIFDGDGLARATGVPLALVADHTSRRLPSPEHRPYALALAGVMAKAPDARSILVTAASARDRSDAVAVALGTAATQTGQRVVVVKDSGFSSNGHHGGSANGHWFPRSQAEGLTTVTLGSSDGATATAAVADLYRDEESHPFVLVAAPSPDRSPTALLLARSTRYAIVSATAGRTRFRDARRTADVLREAGIAVLAGILVSQKPSTRG